MKHQFSRCVPVVCAETRLNMLRHIQTAHGEVQTALEIAKSLADESHRSDPLTVAHRELRRALSRA